ncbi:MAG: DEAD/DEAH box helicase [Bryobacteraceae bacterium]
MIVLRGAFCEGRLMLWAEPGASAAALLAAVAEFGFRPKFTRRHLHEAVAWLPTFEGRPAPSSELPDGGAISDEQCYLAPHVAEVLPLEAPQAIDLLMACDGKRVAAPGVLLGDDLAYWAAALRFSAGLVLRGQFLPSLVREDNGWAARWVPMPTGADAARLEVLASSMPPSARCLVWEAEDREPQTSASSVLKGFTAFILDSLVRSAATPPRGARESLHDEWLAALASPKAALPGRDSEVAALAGHIDRWQRPFRVALLAPFRLSFRLHEPEEDKADCWQVQYLLQGTKDPSLILPAADAWHRNGAAAFGSSGAALREHLLASLGQAASICPRVEASLKQAAPEGYLLDTAGAYQFLCETAGALEQSGFGVMLPSWWTRRGPRIPLQAHAQVKSPAASGGLSLDKLLEFNWELALGGEKISRAELAALARLKQPLVKIRGQWVEIDAEQIQAALDFLKRNPGGRVTAREVLRMAIGTESHAGPLEIGAVQATGWMGDLLARLESRTPFVELPQPEALNGQLRPYQLRGYAWLDFLKSLGLGACLADDMGLGKTIQTLALIQSDRAQGERRPVLLVCPTSVLNNWRKEVERFTPELPVLIHHGVARRRGAAFRKAAAEHAIVLSSYALLHRDQEALSQVEWAGVILDEAQNIKNAGTKQAQAARSLPGGYRIALTGTPVENNVGDLWSLMEFLNPSFLGSENGFRKRFLIPIQVYSDHGASDRLRRITAPFILRRLKTDKSIIADLPDKLEMKVFCQLTREQASLYEAVVQDAQEAIESAEGIGRKGLVLATLVKLKQVCNHPAQFLKDNSALDGRSGKLARITEMLDETLQAGDRSLIFTQFTEMGDILQRHIRETFGIEILYLHGGTPRKHRDRMVERFADPAGPRIFLLSLKAGGTGLNLTQANHVFLFDRWWNPAVENQATDRAFRIGQTKNVQVHKFVCAGTLEERIDEMIERKKAIAGRVVGTGEAWLSELSNAQLRELFALRKDAIGE